VKTLIALSVLSFVCVSGTSVPGTERLDAATAFVPAGSTAITGELTHECNAKTIGFWGNPNGLALIEDGDFLDVLPSLHLVDEVGAPFVTHDIDEFEDWLHDANAVNMAYMLSAQLVAMEFNVLSGKVDVRCQVADTRHGVLSVDRLIEQAINSLINDPYTPAGDPNRHRQELLKNLLDDGNNNLIWV